MALTRDLVLRLGKDGIRVNCIVPGHIVGPMAQGDPAERQRRAQASALGTEGTTLDVAWAALFLASDEARWISGASITVGTAARASLHWRSRLIGASAEHCAHRGLADVPEGEP